MPMPDWTPPTDFNDKLGGKMDGISCGEQRWLLDVGKGPRISASWLPFAPGTKWPLPPDSFVPPSDADGWPAEVAGVTRIGEHGDWQLSAICGEFRFRTIGAPHSLAFSPDGRHLIAATGSTIAIWDFFTGRLIRRLARESDGLVVLPCGDWLLHRQRRLLLDGQTSGRNAEWALPEIIHQVAVAPNGRFAVLICDAGSLVRLEIPSGEWRQFAGTDLLADFIGVLPDGDTVVVAGDAVEAYRLSEPGRVFHFEDAHANVCDAVITADGKRLIAGTEKGDMIGWNLATGRIDFRAPSMAAEYGPLTLAMSRTGRVAAFHGNADFVMVFAPGQSRPTIAQLPTPMAIRAAVFSPDGNWLAVAAFQSGVQSILVWDVAGAMWAVDGGDTAIDVCHLHLTATGDRLVGGHWRCATAWETATGRLLATVDGFPLASDSPIAVSPDEKRFAIATTDRSPHLDDPQIVIVEIDTGHTVQTLIGHQGRILALRFSADGNRLFSGDASGSARVWDLATGRETWRTELPAPTLAQFTADSRFVVAAGDDEFVWMDAVTGDVRERWAGEQAVMLDALAVSPSDGAIVTAGANGLVAHTGPQSRVPLPAPFAGIVGLQFSADGSRLFVHAIHDAESAVIDWPAKRILETDGNLFLDLRTALAANGLAVPASIRERLAHAADGRALAVSLDNGVILIYRRLVE